MFSITPSQNGNAMSHYASIEYPTPQYSVMSAIVDGLPAVVTINGALLSYRHRPEFPIAIVINIDILDVNPNELPTEMEKRMLDQLSDAIEEAVTRGRNAVFVAQQTWNNERVLLFYAREQEMTKEVLEQLQGHTQTRNKWRFSLELDAAWRRAEPFFNAIRPGTV